MIKPPFQTLAPIIPEIRSDPRNPCGDATRWCCLDDQSSEIEVLHFLRCLVVLLKPDVILETGTHLGYGTAALAQGCKDNQAGHVWTVEHYAPFLQRAFPLLQENGLMDWVDFISGDAREVTFDHQIDLLFIDGGTERNLELSHFAPLLSPRGVILMHDAYLSHHYRYQEIPEVYTKIYLPCARGLWLLRPPYPLWPASPGNGNG